MISKVPFCDTFTRHCCSKITSYSSQRKCITLLPALHTVGVSVCTHVEADHTDPEPRMGSVSQDSEDTDKHMQTHSTLNIQKLIVFWAAKNDLSLFWTPFTLDLFLSCFPFYLLHVSFLLTASLQCLCGALHVVWATKKMHARMCVTVWGHPENIKHVIMYGEPFHVWEMWPSPYSEKPVGSEVRQAGPTPMDRFSCGESGLHCT